MLGMFKGVVREIVQLKWCEKRRGVETRSKVGVAGHRGSFMSMCKDWLLLWVEMGNTWRDRSRKWHNQTFKLSEIKLLKNITWMPWWRMKKNHSELNNQRKIICRRNYVLKIGIQLNMRLSTNIFSKYGYKSGNILSLKVMFSVKKSDNHRIDKRLGNEERGE